MLGEINQTVLIVDDNSENIELLSNLLNSVCTIKSASSGAQAIQILMANPLVDLIILDVVMPGMDGFETCAHLKSEPLTDDIPVIFITGLAEDSYEDMGLKLGAVDFITKPFNVDLVKSRVLNHLELKRHRDELESLVMQRTRELQNSQQSALAAKGQLDISFKQLRELSEHLQMVREDERTHIARELHDELGQSLTALKIDLNWLKMKVPHSEELVHEKIIAADLILDNTVDSLRRIYEDLRPGMLDDLGLASAVEYYVSQFSDQSNIACEFVVNRKDINVSNKVAINLFRILQESLTNISRHASATQAKIILHQLESEILLIVEDNGCGWQEQKGKKRKSYGILGIQERINMLNGTFEIISEAGEGSRIELSIPIDSKVAS